MQKIATKIFIGGSVVFGVLGILMILTSSNDNEESILQKLLLVDVFVILPSFALSVAGKYLSGK
jgi:hypothetical protein